MSLIDAYLPDFDFEETHVCEVAASPETVIATAAAHRPDSDPFFRIMITLRELPTRVSGLFAAAPKTRHTAFGLQDFVLLDHQSGHGLVYGLIGQFWRFDYGLVTFSGGDAFRAFKEPGVAKLALDFSAAALPNGRTKLVTQTRVFCPDKASRRKFAPYWYLIRPISGLIRRRVLASIKKASEKAQRA